MEKKLILKLKLNKEDKSSMILQTELDKFQISDEGMKKFFISVLDLAGVDYKVVDKLAETEDLHNLHLLIKKGFTIRIDEMEDHFRFIAHKGQASTSCGVSKEMGISSLLKDAEDFAEEFLEDLKTNTSCGV